MGIFAGDVSFEQMAEQGEAIQEKAAVELDEDKDEGEEEYDGDDDDGDDMEE